MYFTKKAAVELFGSEVKVKEGFRGVPIDADGSIVGIYRVSGGKWALLITFTYQNLTYGRGPHTHQITRTRFNRSIEVTRAAGSP